MQATREALRLWIEGLRDTWRYLVSGAQHPTGQSGGFLSPLLETLRVGHAAQWVEGRTVLDCGCGRGRLVEMLRHDQDYTGVDHNPILVEDLRCQYPHAHFVCASLEDLTFPHSAVFDSIVMTAVVEHLAAAEETIQRVAGFLRPGGVLVITTPTPTFAALLDAGSRLKAFDRGAYVDHKSLFGRMQLERFCIGAGLRLEKYYRFALGGNQLAVARKLQARRDDHPA